MKNDNYQKIRRHLLNTGRCWYCGQVTPVPMRTVDHVVPRASGGRSSKRNMVMACRDCNTAKGNLSLDEFRRRTNDSFPFHGEG